MTSLEQSAFSVDMGSKEVPRFFREVQIAIKLVTTLQ